MHAEALEFEQYDQLQDETCAQRIIAAKNILASAPSFWLTTINVPMYTGTPDLTGDSLKLSFLAAQTDADYLVFCGVHFMAEVADILSSPQQIAILPDTGSWLFHGRYGQSRQCRTCFT